MRFCFFKSVLHPLTNLQEATTTESTSRLAICLSSVGSGEWVHAKDAQNVRLLDRWIVD